MGRGDLGQKADKTHKTQEEKVNQPNVCLVSVCTMLKPRVRGWSVWLAMTLAELAGK